MSDVEINRLEGVFRQAQCVEVNSGQAQILTAQAKVATGGLVDSPNYAQHCALARAALAQDADELALLDREIDTAQSRNALDAEEVRLLHVGKHDDVFGCSLPGRIEAA